MKMQHLFLIPIATTLLLACSDSNNTTGSEITDVSLLDTAYVDYKGKTPQTVFYDFSTDSMTSIPLHSWDIAINTTTGTIHTNGGLYGTGVTLFQTKSIDIDQDLGTFADSIKYIQTKSHDLLAHEIKQTALGSDTVYLIQDAEGNQFKVKFESFGIAGKYTLKVAHGLDAKATDLIGTMTFQQGYVWIDLSESKDVSKLFPNSADWDICFTRALETKQNAGPGVDSMIIATSAILVNTDNSVAVSIDSVNGYDEITKIQGVNFLQAFDVIGSGWYNPNYDPQTHISNPTVNDLFYLIKIGEDEFYKVQFLSFYGPKQESFVTVFKHDAL